MIPLTMLACLSIKKPEKPLSQPPMPPIAEKIVHVHNEHGIDRSDPYHWMRNREDPKVIALLFTSVVKAEV